MTRVILQLIHLKDISTEIDGLAADEICFQFLNYHGLSEVIMNNVTW